MELEIRPEPSVEERAAIEAALAQEAETSPDSWPQSVLPGPDEADEP